MNRARRSRRRRPTRPSRLARWIRSRYFWIPALIVVVLGVVFLLFPRRVAQIVSIDGEHGWRKGAAPPRRKIVWKPAQPFETLSGDVSAEDNWIRPQLAERGTVLYFTLHSPEHGADIYRSRLIDGRWQPAETVEELNTPANDIGPVFQPGERRLYLYSNRAGGFGGFDLYVSDRNDDGSWTTPTNLGPQVNSPALEFDPAVTADGKQLYFSSNRTARMSREMADGQITDPGERWDTTLRAELGGMGFDIFVARREASDQPWSPAEPLKGVNLADSNEGSPAVSPTGTFVYFSSDRKQRGDEGTNYDLYRSRIDGERAGSPQNLGPGVNTAANEVEPALSDEGFRLVFSRDEYVPSAEGGGDRYRLFSSVAVEVEEESHWEAGNLGMLLRLFKKYWWWIGLAVLAAALIAAIIWYLRQVSLRRLPLPACLLVAMLIHVLGGVGLFYCYFGDDIIEFIKKKVMPVAVATHISTEDMHQSHEPGPETYEKVADLEDVKTVKPTDVVRQVVETPNVPIKPDVPHPNVPAKLTREFEEQRPEATLPKSETVLSGGPELARRQMTNDELMLEKIEVEQTEAQQATAENKPPDVEVELTRQQTQPNVADVPPIERRRIDPRQLELAQEKIEAEQTSDAPVESEIEPDMTVARADRPAAEPDATEQVETEEVTAPADSPAASEPKRVALQMDRRAPAPQTDAPKMTRQTMSADTALRMARADTSIDQISEEVVESKADEQPTDLSRTAHTQAEPAAQPKVATEEIAAPAESTAADARPAGLAIQMERQVAETPQSGTPGVLKRQTPSDTALRLAQADTTVDPVAEDPAGAATLGSTAADATIARNNADSQAQAAPAEGQVETETLAAAATAAQAAPQGMAVNVNRSQPGADTSVPQLMDPAAASNLGGLRLAKAGVVADHQIAPASFDTPAGPAMNAELAREQGTLPDTSQPAAGDPIETAELALPQTAGGAGLALPRAIGVSIERQQTVTGGASATGASLKLAMADRPVALALAGESSGMPSGSATPADSPSSGSVQADLARAARASVLPGGGPVQVDTETPVAAAGSGTAEPAAPKGVNVTLARQGSSGAATAPTAGSLEVAFVERRIGLGGADAASDKIAELLSGSGPESSTVAANLARSGNGRAPSATGAVPVEMVATEGPAVAAGGEGTTSSPRGVGVEVSRRGIVAPVVKGGALRVPAVSQTMGLSGTGELAESAVGSATTPTPKGGNVAAKLSRARGPQSLIGLASVEVETDDATGGVATSGDKQGESTALRAVEVLVGRRGSTDGKVAEGTLALAMVGSDFGSPRLAGPADDLTPVSPSALPGSGNVAGQIGRASRDLEQVGPAAAAIPAETVGTDSATGDGVNSGPPSIAGIPVGLERARGPMLALPVKTSGKIGGLHDADNPRLVIGSLTNEANNAPPWFSPVTSQIARRPARAATTFYAGDSVGLATMMKLRLVAEEEKEDLVVAFGGDDETLKAVRRGLAWIVKQQQNDGRWCLEKFADQQSKGQGKNRSDTAATALALLPLLGDGNTPTNGPYRSVVAKGIKWMVEHQKPDGDLYTGGSSNGHMYSHGMATIALCEAYGMTRDPNLREPAQLAINYISNAQHKEGGWRYTPGQPGDTSVFGWQIMALKSAQMAELDVPPEVFDRARQWLARNQKNRGEFKYQRSGGDSPAMTAEGLLCYQYLGATRGDERLHEGAKYLLQHLPQKGKDTSYCWYYANQVMYHLQGEYWQQWNEAMDDTVKGTQQQNGPMAGSWDPKDKWEQAGGRLYSTALRVLMLEVYYRHLPLYRMYEGPSE